jgi:hypothetical protein
LYLFIDEPIEDDHWPFCEVKIRRFGRFVRFCQWWHGACNGLELFKSGEWALAHFAANKIQGSVMSCYEYHSAQNVQPQLIRLSDCPFEWTGSSCIRLVAAAIWPWSPSHAFYVFVFAFTSLVVEWTVLRRVSNHACPMWIVDVRFLKQPTFNQRT